MKNSKNTENIFDHYAQTYQDKFMDLEEYRSSLDQFCEYLNPNSRLLDIGCGPANISVYLNKNLPKLQVWGIDLSANMLEMAKKNIPSAVIRKMDCREIDKLEGTFDAIVCGFCLPYLSQTEVTKFLKDAAALLNKNGIIYISTMTADHYKSQWIGPSQGGQQSLLTHYHQADFIRMGLENNNFSILHEERLEEQEREGTKFRDLILIARKSF